MNLVFDPINIVLTFWVKPMLVIALIVYVVKQPDFKSAATNHWLLLLAVISPVLLIAFFSLLPRIDIGILPATLAVYTQAQFLSAEHGLFSHSGIVSVLLCVIYITGFAYALSKLCLAILYTCKIARNAQSLVSEDIDKLKCGLAKQFSVNTRVEIKVSPNLTAPVMWGRFTPQILLPPHFTTWGEARLRRVLAHEYAHIARGDWLSKLLAQFLCTIFWVNPLMWRVAKECAWHAELACDDLVVSKLQCRAEYADDLIELSTYASHQSLAVLGFIKKSELYLRINAILDGGTNRSAPDIVSKGFLLCLVTILLLPFSLLQAKQSSYAQREAAVNTFHVVGVYDIGEKRHALSAGEPEFVEVNNYLTLNEIKKRYESIVAVESHFIDTTPLTKPLFSFVQQKAERKVTTEIKLNSALEFENVDVLPLTQLSVIRPKYPKRALIRSLEATVVVALDVDSTGRVRNPRIVSSDHSKVFNASVLNAVKGFVYQPMTINGRAIITRNVEETFIFTLEDAADTRNFH